MESGKINHHPIKTNYMLNPKSTIYQTGWLDLVFANRNKSYGAYELRLNYNRRLGRSLLIASFFVLALFSYPLIQQWFIIADVSKSYTIPKADDDIIIVSLPPLKKPVDNQATPVSLPKSDPVKEKMTRFVEPVAVSTPVTENPPTIDELQSSAIASQSSDGIESTANLSPAASGNGTGENVAGGGGDGNELVPAGLLEKYPEFPGGMSAFMKFLRKNLRYPDRAVQAEISGKVLVSFVVEKDGRLTDIKIVRGIGFGCDEEAARVLKKSPAWQPGIQNNRQVRVLYTIPLLFQLGG